MVAPGNNTPPIIFNFTQSCTAAGDSVLKFSCNKAVLGSVLRINISDLNDPNQFTVWEDGFDENRNAMEFNIPDATRGALRNGSYRMEADNGENVDTLDFEIDCTATVACDLDVKQPTPYAARAGTGLGYATVEMNSSHLPIKWAIINGPKTGQQTDSQGGLGTTMPVPPGYYTVRFQDSAGCVKVLYFEILPPALVGCIDPQALNYNPDAEEDDGSCVYPVPQIAGCTNPNATNYNASATQDDGSCVFGPPVPAVFDYSGEENVTLVYSEPENKWVSEQTSRAQVLLPLDGHHVHALPLPGQSNDAPTARYLWEHDTGPEKTAATVGNPVPGILLYGKRHRIWLEFIILGQGVHTIKNLDNLVLVSNDDLPSVLTITSPEQGKFIQELIPNREHLTTVERQEQVTYVQLNAPLVAPWGGRIRAQYVRVRIDFTGQRQLRMSKLFAILRESVT